MAEWMLEAKPGALFPADSNSSNHVVEWHEQPKSIGADVQALPTEALIPMSLLHPTGGRVLLCGDPKCAQVFSDRGRLYQRTGTDCIGSAVASQSAIRLCLLVQDTAS